GHGGDRLLAGGQGCGRRGRRDAAAADGRGGALAGQPVQAGAGEQQADGGDQGEQGAAEAAAARRGGGGGGWPRAASPAGRADRSRLPARAVLPVPAAPAPPVLVGPPFRGGLGGAGTPARPVPGGPVPPSRAGLGGARAPA